MSDLLVNNAAAVISWSMFVLVYAMFSLGRRTRSFYIATERVDKK